MAEKSQLCRNVRKYKLVNTVMASFNTIMGQMIVMSQQIRGVKPCTLTFLLLFSVVSLVRCFVVQLMMSAVAATLDVRFEKIWKNDRLIIL